MIAASPSPIEALVRRGREIQGSTWTAFGRAGWGLADQALSSLGNFALTLTIARFFDIEAFGAFALAFAVYLLFLSVSRAMVSEPLAVRYGDATRERWLTGCQESVGVAGLLGIIGSVGLVIGGALATGVLREAFFGLAVVLPFLLIQDCVRLALFVARFGRSAFLSDAAWVAVTVPALVLALRGTPTSVASAILAWGIGAAAATFLGLRMAHVTRIFGPFAWLASHRDLVRRLVPEVLVREAAVQVALYEIAALVNVAAVGAVRGAQLLLAPAFMVHMAASLVGVPEAVRARSDSLAALLRLCRRSSIVVAAVVGLTGLLMGLIPGELGRLLLTDKWESARALLAPVTLAMAGTVAPLGAWMGLRALADARRSLIAQSTSVATLGTVGLGALVAGLPGAVWGLALGSWLTAAAWWYEFRASVRSQS